MEAVTDGITAAGLAEFIEPFRVKPGSKVRLKKDFDPASSAGVRTKKDGSSSCSSVRSCSPTIRRGSMRTARMEDNEHPNKASTQRGRTGRSGT